MNWFKYKKERIEIMMKMIRNKTLTKVFSNERVTAMSLCVLEFYKSELLICRRGAVGEGLPLE